MNKRQPQKSTKFTKIIFLRFLCFFAAIVISKKIGSEFAYDSLPFQSKEKNYEDYEVEKNPLRQFADVRRQP